MAKAPKGFISLGSPDSWLNVSYVDQEKSYLDKRTYKVAVIDIYGNRYNVDPRLVRNKMRYRT